MAIDEEESDASTRITERSEAAKEERAFATDDDREPALGPRTTHGCSHRTR
jgi:hypothetical protein